VSVSVARVASTAAGQSRSGCCREYRRKGIDAVLCYAGMKAAIERRHAPIEMSSMPEDNVDVLRPLEGFGGRIYRRYLLVARPMLSDGA
jgi:hypothetical protein